MISTKNQPLGFFASRRNTRRWIVAVYWLLVLGFTSAFLRHQFRHAFDAIAILYTIQVLINIPAILGGVRAGGLVKPFRGVRWAPLIDRDDIQTVFGPPKPVVAGLISPEAELDERERHDRDRVHFVAYTAVRWLALLLFASYLALGVFRADWTERLGPTFFFLLTLVLWSLPQSLILWNDPDMEEPR